MKETSAASERGEEWIEEQLLEFLSLSVAGHATSPEEFAARIACEAGPRAELVVRLQALVRLEQGLAVLCEEPIVPGTTLADFEVHEQVGAGGMGRVFRATQKSVSRSVAIKVSSSSLVPTTRQRFLREAQAVAALRHPNIVPLHQVGEHLGTPFLVFEFSEGRSLSAILAELRREGPRASGSALGRPDLPYERAVILVLLSVLEALEAAHVAGIVHRDVKPGNILLERDGRVRVIDFGLALRVGQDSLTESRELLGTVSYMAPEVVRNPHAAGPWSDVWSAGVLLYELLTLRRPFEGHTVLETLRLVEREEIPPLSVSHSVRKPLSAIVEKAMSRAIETRYPSALEFANDLRADLAGREVQARPSTRWTRAGRRLQRHPALTATVVGLVLLVSLLAGVWRSRSEVMAQVRRASAEEITREALLWWHADGEPLGSAATRSNGRDYAMDSLESALLENPYLAEARVELAQYAAQRNQAERALELIQGLERDGYRLRSMAWIREHLREAASGGLQPPDGEELEDAKVDDLDRLAWARHFLSRSQNERAMEVLRPLETHPILGPVAHYLQFEASHTRQRRDLVRANAYLYGALVVTPDHPTLLANQAVLFDERQLAFAAQEPLAPAQQRERDSLLADIEALLPLLDRAEVRAPWVRGLWLNHGVLLANAGRTADAFLILRQGLQHHSGDASLTHLFAQACFDRWAASVGPDEPMPAQELEALRASLDLALETSTDRPENLYSLTYVHYLREDRAAALATGELAFQEYFDQAPSNPRTTQQLANFDRIMEWATELPEAE